MNATWPQMLPDVQEIRSQLATPGGGRLITALIKSAAIVEFGGKHRDALQASFDIAVEFSTKMLCISPMEQSVHTPDTKPKCFAREAPDPKPPQFGLTRVGVDFRKYPDFPEAARSGLAADDIYTLRDKDGRLLTVIKCMAEEAKTANDGPPYRAVPHCEQNFISQRLNGFVSVTYNRRYLSEWQTIQQSWDQLLASFVVDALLEKSQGK